MRVEVGGWGGERGVLRRRTGTGALLSGRVEREGTAVRSGGNEAAAIGIRC